jgi:hypothetical protein
VKKLSVCVLAVCSLISSSCATMLKGNSEDITVVSDPSGALVSANDGGLQGVTPVAFTVPSKQDLNFTVTKQGYLPQEVPDPTSFRWGYEIWAFVEFVIPMGVDLADGAAWGHDHTTVTAHLEPNSQAPAAAAAAAAATAPASPFGAPPVASAQTAPVALPAPGVHAEAVAAAPVPAPAAVPSVSAMTQQPSGSAPQSGPAPTTPE